MKRTTFTILSVLALIAVFASPTLAKLPGGSWWSFYQVQNVGTGDGNLVMQAFDVQGGASNNIYTSEGFTIQQGKALAYHPGLAPTYPSGDRIGFSPDLPAGFEGSAVLSADVPIVAIAQVGNNKSGSVGVEGGTASAFYQGIGGSLAAGKVSFPTVKHNFGDQTTTFYVQAAGQDANVTITYNMNDGSSYSQSTTINANRTFIFDPADAGVVSTNCGAAASSPCLGAATVTSTSGPIVGVVMEHPHTGSPAPFALSTRGFTQADEDTTIIAPTIKNSFVGSDTGWSIQNVGDQPTVVTVRFTVTNKDSTAPSSVTIGQVFTDNETIQPGQAVVFSKFRRNGQGNLGGMPGGVFAAGVATSNGQPLVGTVNESNASASVNIPGGVGKAVYASFAQKNATAKVALPLVKELFANNTTGVTVVNAGTANTQFIATYTDAAGVARTIQTVRTNIAPGEAIPFYQVFNQAVGQRFTQVSGFTTSGNFQELNNTKNSVVVTSSNGQAIVVLAQEANPNNKDADIKNYEGFNLQ